MKNDLLTDVEKLMSETGLSAHRIGILLASNGRLVDRLRAGRRIWPETDQQIRKRIAEVSAERTADTKRPATVSVSPAAPAAPTQEHSHESTSKA